MFLCIHIFFGEKRLVIGYFDLLCNRSYRLSFNNPFSGGNGSSRVNEEIDDVLFLLPQKNFYMVLINLVYVAHLNSALLL